MKHNSKAKQYDVNKEKDIPGCRTDLDREMAVLEEVLSKNRFDSRTNKMIYFQSVTGIAVFLLYLDH